MFGRGFPLFKLFGFSVKADWTWLIIVVLLTWSLAVGAFPTFFPGLTPQTYMAMGVVGAMGLFLSIVLHELGHSLAARRVGVEMRGITLFVFGGVAEMKNEPPSPLAEFVIAIAGPIVSVAIGVFCLLAAWLSQAAGVVVSVYGVLFYLGFINLILVVFNMIPAFPLDGGRVLRAVLWHVKGSLTKATRITSTLGSAFGLVLIVGGVVSFIGGNVIGGVWWFVLGMFLRMAAQMSYQQVLIRRALEGEPVSRFMQVDVKTVPADTPLDEFVDEYVYRHHFKMFPVAKNGELRGCLTIDRVKNLPREEWPLHTVAEFSEPCSDENTIGPDTDATVALTRMSQNGHSRLMVVDRGELKGIVAIKDLMRFISMKMELEDVK